MNKRQEAKPQISAAGRGMCYLLKNDAESSVDLVLSQFPVNGIIVLAITIILSGITSYHMDAVVLITNIAEEYICDL